MDRRLGRRGLASAVGVTAAVAVFWFAAPAQAAQRYASPVGTGSSCEERTPCSLQTATDVASFDNEVIVEPGTYTASAQIDVELRTNVHGRAGAPRPRLNTSAFVGVSVEGGSTLRDFEIHHSIGNVGLSVRGTADRVFVESSSYACAFGGDGAAILNSVCWTTGDLAAGVTFASVAGPGVAPMTATLRNVTAFAQNSDAISVNADGFARLVVNATNVSAFGGQADVYTVEGGDDSSAIVNLDYSSFEYVDVVEGGQVTLPGPPTNTTAPARFVDTTTGNFHQLPGSPTIDRGITSAANGAADIDGEARAQGASTDIGADEFPIAGQAGGGSPATTLFADKTKPVASALDVQPGAFAALSGRGSSLISAKRKPAKGATVKYRLSEGATVTFTVERVQRGRKKKSRCVPGRRKGKACKRYKKLKGSFTHAGSAGTNSLRFSGRLASKPLRPGSYRLVGTARDAAGNKSKAVRTSFWIVRG